MNAALASRVSLPRRVIVADHESHWWAVVSGGITHDFVWWPATGALLWKFQRDETSYQFITLGPRYSPCRSVAEAQVAIQRWVEAQQLGRAS